MVALIAMCVCGMGFFVVFGAIRLYTNSFLNRRRKPLPNEENPQMDGMEWDDSGLNITENPLDKLEVNFYVTREKQIKILNFLLTQRQKRNWA